jgi:hypothetical protein
LKIRVRQFPPGLDRSRRAAPRTVVAFLAMISIPWVLLGATGTTAIASASRDDPGAAHANAHAGDQRDDDPEGRRDRCGRDLHDERGQRSDREVDGCDCCEPSGRRVVTTPATPAPPAPAAPEAAHPPAAPGGAAHPSIEAPRPVAAAPHVPRDPVDQQPPLLAPPSLTVPSPSAPAAVSTTPVAIYVITLSTLLLATAISIAALVLVRRSG